MVSGETRAVPERPMLVRAAQKMDGRRRSTDVAWWVNQRSLVSLKARLDVKNGAGYQDFVDDLRHGHPPFAGSCVFVCPQETDNWEASEMDVPGCVCCGGDSGEKSHFMSDLPVASCVRIHERHAAVFPCCC